MPEIMQTVYKTNQQAYRSITRQALMQPGNINGRNNCTLDYGGNAWDFNNNPSAINIQNTPFSSQANSFDIRDNKFVTNVRNAVVHLIFYVTEYDTIGNQLIHDNYRVREFV
jgi:type II secretory pathway pseudopilin PulG